MLPSLYSGFSLVNFLLELKDFRRLAGAIVKRTNVLKALLGQREFESWAKLFREGGTLKEASRVLGKTVANVHLQYSFGWKPLVSDIQKLYKQLTTVNSRLDEIWKRQNQPQTRHFKWELLPKGSDEVWSGWSVGTAVSGVNPSFNYSYPNSGSAAVVMRTRTRYRYIVRPIYHATLRYSYSCPGALDARAKTRGWLDALGVRADPSIVWNAIPFSFLVDWIVDVSGFLRRFSVDNLGLSVRCEDFASSVKFHYMIQREAYVTWGPHQTNSQMILEEEGLHYERRVGIPDIGAALKVAGMDSDKASLAASLLRSRY
jgi:hypothetical protein